MENITFYEQINQFLENKMPRKPKAYIHSPEPAHASMDLCTQLGFQKPMKGKFSVLMLMFGTNPILSENHSKSLFSHYIKPYMAHFQDIQKILRKSLRFNRNSESKREFFTKYPQFNFILIETISSLDPRVLKFTNHFCLIVNRFN